MNPQMCVLLCLANGLSRLTESVWESRFRYVEELKRMGAKININGRCAEVEGIPELVGASVRAVDLRAGCAMVIAGLAAKGTTQIDEIYHIFRGYEDLIGKLQKIGADIKVVYPKKIEFSDYE
jgi:UDP-N-acetylglucosamine 1-carboxyvinyltransferase